MSSNHVVRRIHEKLKYGDFKLLAQTTLVKSFEIAVDGEEYTVIFHDKDWANPRPSYFEVFESGTEAGLDEELKKAIVEFCIEHARDVRNQLKGTNWELFSG